MLIQWARSVMGLRKNGLGLMLRIGRLYTINDVSLLETNTLSFSRRRSLGSDLGSREEDLLIVNLRICSVLVFC